VMKIIIGIFIGVIATSFYPDVVPHVTGFFVESGARDSVIQTLTNIK
jgi:hypothetical protein